MRKLARLMLVAGVAALMFPSIAANAATSKVTVWPGDMNGWAFVQETPPGSGQMEQGPETPPLGSGSANLQVTSALGGMALVTGAHAGTRFDEIDALEYSTYRVAGAPALAISLQFTVDYDLTDANTAFQGRLVFEPYYTETVTTGDWQTWDPMDGKWWATRAPFNTVCSQAAPCTWSQVLSTWPDAGIRDVAGPAVILKAGSGWAGGFDGNVDALKITIDGDTTVYDFELDGPKPTSKDDCKNGGYKDFTDDNNKPFKNQGQCIKFVNHDD